MRGYIFTIVCVLLLASVPAMAQTAASPDAPSKEDVVRLLDLTHTRALMVQMMEGMRGGMKAGAEAGLKQELPDATPEQLAKADLVADAVFTDLPIDEIVDAIIPIYQRHFTKSDLDAVVAFYSSPAGQKMLKEQPALMAESMKAGQDIMLKKLPAITEALKAKVAELAKQEAGKNPPAATPK